MTQLLLPAPSLPSLHEALGLVKLRLQSWASNNRADAAELQQVFAIAGTAATAWEQTATTPVAFTGTPAFAAGSAFADSDGDGAHDAFTGKYDGNTLFCRSNAPALGTGVTDQLATFSSGSGADTLISRYTMQTSDTSTDLDQLSANALTLSSARNSDTAGYNSNLTLASLRTAGSFTTVRDKA